MHLRNILKFLRRANGWVERKVFKSSSTDTPYGAELLDLDSANRKISELINSDGGVMIARYGNTEMLTVANYFGIKAGRHPFKYIRGDQEAWWWEPKYADMIAKLSGFYPATPENLEIFSKLIIEDTDQLDMLGCWINNEKLFSKKLATIPKTKLLYLEPYFSTCPWTASLRGKKVVVVHPFAKSIALQYSKRELLFDNPDVLPEFASLKIIPAVQSLGKEDSRFSSWFDALEWMKAEIDSSDYDVCLIGCGAYGFPLAAHVKRQGKKAVHLGGALQLLFGIRGKRWENEQHGVIRGFRPGQYAALPNEHWIRPSEEERPDTASQVEGSTYW